MGSGGASAFLGNYKKRQLWLRIVIALAAIVVFFTTYALILPAITMEGNLVCELEEHTHTSECYEAVYVEDSATLVCSREHEHTDECYEKSGHYEEQLVCEIPEHTHTAACYDAAAATPANGADETYWIPITSTSDLTKDGTYIIVTSEGDVALSGAGTTTNVTANMTPSEVKPGYYTTELGDTYWWELSSNGSGKLQNVDTGNYLRLDNSTVINGNNSTDNKFTYHQNNDDYSGWEIYSTKTSGYLIWQQTTTYRLVHNGTSFTNNTNSYSPMTIYKMYTAGSDGGGGGGGTPESGGSGNTGATKPTYPAYIDVSGAKYGNTIASGVAGEYWSDPSTSRLESWFTGVKKDDGKVLTDKSVIYGKDDYGAFSSYEPNTFGVTLSALGQSYALTDELDIKVPLDVVFVLDTSGSMVDTKFDGTTSANVMVEALNDIMAVIMEQNEDNRVGVVSFSGGGHKLLELGHYTADNNIFFEEGKYNISGNVTKDTLTLTPASSVQRTDGEMYRGSFTGWWGTYTQHGIATGAQEFFDVTDTTVSGVATKVIDGREISAAYTVTRRPIIILLSDGDPTYCTHEYSNVLNASNIYGNGNSGYDSQNKRISKDTNNNKGIMGYYTILSAQYYKNAIAKHYNTDAYFYSVGIGMYQSGSNSYSMSVSGDDYKRAVLNPTRANIAALANCTNAQTDSPLVTNSNERNISDYSDVTCHMLYQLLNNQYNNTTVTVSRYNDNGSSESLYGVPGRTSNSAKVITDPYYSTGYNYADNSFFTTQASVEALRDAFADAINFNNDLTVYGFLLRNNEPAAISDTIGDGMEIKGAPVLRYGGVNYSPVGEPTVEGNSKIYHYEGTYVDQYSHREVDLSKIYAEVETVNGVQTVRLYVNDAEMPVYLADLDIDGNPMFYYEELPVRLIYQVGLTDEAQQDIAALREAGSGSLTYYTNAWENGVYANSGFQPTTKNPYYKDNTYNKDTLNKPQNTTSTESYAWLYDPNCDANHVSEHLGNNGKLVFDASKEVLANVDLEKVDENGSAITADTARFELYDDEELTSLVGTYETNENGRLTINSLEVGKTYYLKEIKAPAGYALISEAKAFTVDLNGKPAIDGSDFYVSVAGGVLKFKNTEPTSFSVLKKWDGGTGDFVEVELLADGETTGLYATLNADNGWYFMWNDLPKYGADGTQIVYSIRELAVDGYTSDVHLWTGAGDPYGQTGSQGWEQKSGFENGKTYMLVHKSNGYDVAIGINTSTGEPWRYDIDLSDLGDVPNNLKWKASISNNNITLTNVGTNQKLVLNSSNRLAVGGNNNHADTWKYDTSNKILYTTYSYRSGGRSHTDTYYYNSSNGVTTNQNDATQITPYAYYNTVVEDPVEKGATHYIIKNTKDNVSGDLSLTFKKVNAEDGTLVNGAALSLYRETGPIEGAVIIPGTSDRYGIVVESWTSGGNGKTFNELPYGNYYLVETEAPAGYEGLEEPIIFTVGAVDGVKTATIVQHPTESGQFTELNIPNTANPAYELPETGGIGTPIIYALGALLVIGALMYGSFLRRKSERRAK
ncbi:MAG: SpaA isopeptide-forming pilin-related protein [Bacillota bacterium]|nr:SpaA isopeptide-forming pilin-related protein [Bacillota bacterium]